MGYDPFIFDCGIVRSECGRFNTQNTFEGPVVNWSGLLAGQTIAHRRWLYDVQQTQDGGKTWGEAVAFADESAVIRAAKYPEAA